MQMRGFRLQPESVQPSAPLLQDISEEIPNEILDRKEMEQLNSVKANSRVFLCELHTWARIACFVYCLLLIMVVIITPLQEKTGFKNNRRLSTVLTQTANIWTPVSVKSNPVINSQSSKCPLFNGINNTVSDVYIQPVILTSVGLDARYLVLVVLVSAAMFQILLVINETWYYLPLMDGNNHVGVYLERSISFPLIIVALCAQTGLTDLWTVLSLMFNSWASMIFCFFAEVLFQCDGGQLDLLPIRALKSKSDADSNIIGGYKLYPDGVAHYHAIAMFAAWVLLAMTIMGVQSNVSLVDACFSTSNGNSLSVPMICVLYIQMGSYCLILLGQTFSLYAKFKPSRAKGIPSREKNRTFHAIYLENYFLMLDFSSKVTFVCVIYFSSFISY